MARICLDDCADDRMLAVLLREAGHEVRTPRTDGTRGVDDEEHLRHAAANGLILLTANPGDFRALHEEWDTRGQPHPGIFLVYQDNDIRRDLTRADVVRAIGRLLASGIPIEKDCHILNHWR